MLDETPENAGKAEALLQRMDLADSINEFPNRLSGGMQRRVALARAFATEPQILLLDEPFVSLDVPVGNLLRQLLLDLWQQSPTTIIFVTHDLRESIDWAMNFSGPVLLRVCTDSDHDNYFRRNFVAILTHF